MQQIIMVAVDEEAKAESQLQNAQHKPAARKGGYSKSGLRVSLKAQSAI